MFFLVLLFFCVVSFYLILVKFSDRVFIGLLLVLLLMLMLESIMLFRV